jgi:hypothetical protein
LAAQYLLKHFEELTLYLKDPRLAWTNNSRERGLRGEKTMLDSSKFRKTRNGRAVMDILRTTHATCIAAEVDLAEYLSFLYQHQEDLEQNPANYTPYEYSKIRVAQKTQDASPTNQMEASTH